MKRLLILPLLALTACGTAKTPEERYFTSVNLATATLKVGNAYADECLKQPVADPCYDVLPKLGKATEELMKAKEQADKVIVTKDVTYYELAITAMDAALAKLREIVIREASV